MLKHDVIRRGPMLECLRCGQFWESKASSMIFSEGICPGPQIYGPPQTGHGAYLPTEDQYGGVSTNYTNPTKPPGIEEFYIAPAVDIFPSRPITKRISTKVPNLSRW